MVQAKIRPVQLFHSIQQVADDLCYHAGRSYVVRVDCYLDWPIHCSHTTANFLIAVFTETLAKQQYKMHCGQSGVHNSLFKASCIIGASSTKSPHCTISKAVRRHRQLQRLWKHTQCSVDRMILE